MKSAVSQCPIEEAMVLLSGRWPTLLLYYLQQGTKRFSELQRDNPTISHRILSLELRKLEMAGIVQRTAYEGYPSRVEYALTSAGRKLIPLIDALGDWWSETQPERAESRGDDEAIGSDAMPAVAPNKRLQQASLKMRR